MDTFYRLNGRTYVMEYADEDEGPQEDISEWPDDEALDSPIRNQAAGINAQRYRVRGDE